MVLSTGTLNLKFMQRAAARAAKTEPAASPVPAAVPVSVPGSAAPSSVASPLPASPAPAPPAAMAAPPTPVSVYTPADSTEDDAGAKWVLPRRNAEAGPGPSTQRVQFVASYLPFLEDEEPVSGMAPGRMSFGMAAATEPKDEGGGDDDDGEFEMSDSEEEEPVRQVKGKGRALLKNAPRYTESTTSLARTVSRANEPTPEPEEVATFQRPRGFSPDRSKGKGSASPQKKGAQPASTNWKPKKEQKDKKPKSALSANLYSRLKDKLSISGSSRESSASPASSGASTPTTGRGKKRGRSDDSSLGGHADGTGGKRAKVGGVGRDGLGGTIDEREKRAKAAKKAAKKKEKEAGKGRFFG